MPSFDIVSEIEMNEVQNAVDNANREISCRFDFKGVDASFSLNQKDSEIKLSADADFQIRQMNDILRDKMSKRNIDPASLDFQEPEQSGKRFNEIVKIKSGIDQAMAKKVVKTIKDSKLKVTTQIQGETVRVTGKKRDDLQEVIALIRKSELGQPFQFNNFRD
jgi:uncharacterized protein YajQ (UPF0234 family)